MYHIEKIRADFPILSRKVYGRPLIYLDNAATTQKPRQVIEAMTDEYYNANANVHRGIHFLSQKATDLHEAARNTVRAFINARSTNEIIFTRGTTESINLVAACFGQAFINDGDEVILSQMEHHSNIVPWQLLQAKKKITIKVIPTTTEGELDLEAYTRLFSPHTRIVAVTHVSNVLGTVNPIHHIIATAHAHNVPVLVDGAQSVPHMPVDVQDLDCDFLAFSGHKVYGPTGIGVLYGKERLLEAMPPYMGGGEMIHHVSFQHTTFASLPYKFEAGTPDYVASVGLAKALDYISQIGLHNIATYEQSLVDYAVQRLSQIPQMQLYGTPQHHSAVISFNMSHIHHSDLGTLLDRLGIAVRTGHHCAEPLVRSLGCEGTVRASLALYNTKQEIDALADGILQVSKMF